MSSEQSTRGSPQLDGRHGSLANDDDIRFAYRLLLGRDPDPSGFEHHRQLLAGSARTPRALAQMFLESDEFIRHRASSEREVELDGYSIFVRDEDIDIGSHVGGSDEYEPHVAAVVRELLRPGDVFVDVGANIGIFTNLAAHLVGANGHVVAIEPMDKNLQLIYHALDKNQFEHVEVHACAVSDRLGMVRMATASLTSNGQVLPHGFDEREGLRTQTRRLDDLCAGLKRIDLVKFDIEGYELLAWRGFGEGLRRHRPVVLTEFHPHCMRTYAGVDPLVYLEELFHYGNCVVVLAWDGSRHTCAGPSDVMARWEATDRATRSNGTDHLDLLIHPGTDRQ